MFAQFGDFVVRRDVDRIDIGRAEPFADIPRGGVIGVGRDPEFLKAMPQGQRSKDTRRFPRIFVAAMGIVDRISDMAGIEADRLSISFFVQRVDWWSNGQPIRGSIDERPLNPMHKSQSAHNNLRIKHL